MKKIVLAASTLVVLGACGAVYASTLSHPGRCQPANSALEYQHKVSAEHPDKNVWVQKVQAVRFLWEGKQEVKCRAGTYAAVLVGKAAN